MVLLFYVTVELTDGGHNYWLQHAVQSVTNK